VKHLLLKLEPVIWALFGGGMMVGALLYPAYLLVVGVAAPLGIAPAEAVSYDRFFALASHPLGRLAFLAATALPLWAAAHHIRHLWIDFGQLKTDALFGMLCYGGAAVGSLFAIAAVIRL
jgi:fumarate reductase subunit D